MKSVMSGQPVSLIGRVRSALDIFGAYRGNMLGNARKIIALHRELCETYSRHTGGNVRGARILDIGCGQTANQVALFAADGADVVGVDMEVPTYRMNLGTLLRVVRTNGVERAVKSLARHLLFDRGLFSELSGQYGKTIPYRELRTELMSATKLSFSDESFDFIYSLWVFEHIDDVPAAVREMNRVLKPVGVAWIGVHLFPGLSGGHHLKWLREDESAVRRVPPWDHLRDNRCPANVYLNKLTLQAYRDIFRENTHIIEEKLLPEKFNPLTPDLEQELARKGYTREDLLTRNALFTCRKRARPPGTG